MKNIVLRRRYARAFFEYAIQNQMTEQGLADLELLSETLNSNRELRNILSQPFISKEKKETVIRKIFEGKISDKTLSFINLMLEKNRYEIISDIIIPYREIYNTYKHIAEVTITTAVKIDEPMQQKLIGFIKNKIDGDIKITNKIDKNIIGGFIINYLDYQYDRSIRNELNSLQSIFNENLYVKVY